MKHITITGSLGSGKSVVSSILKEKLGFDIESAGSLQRKMAQDYGMSIIEFNKYMETHPEFDHELDDFVKKQGLRNTPMIFDSRLAWYFIPQSLKIYLYVNDEIAAKRVFNDSNRINEKYNNVEVAKQKIIQRRNSEVLRFKNQYKVNLEDFRNYDLIIDTSYSTPIEIVNIIIDLYKRDKSQNNELWLSPYTLNPTQSIRNHSFDKIDSISPYFNKISDYIDNPIEVVVLNGDFYIIDGHKRVLLSIMKYISLLPCKLINLDRKDVLPFNQEVADYIKDNCTHNVICDWKDIINYINESKKDGI